MCDNYGDGCDNFGDNCKNGDIKYDNLVKFLRFGNYTCAMWSKLTEAATCVRSFKEDIIHNIFRKNVFFLYPEKEHTWGW